MLRQLEQREQQAVLRELPAGPDQALVDAATTCRRPAARIASPFEASIWSLAIVAGALSSHVMLALGLLGLLLAPSNGLDFLLLASVFLAPPATLCSLLIILMACTRRNRRNMLIGIPIGILTLPLNVFMSWGLYGLMAYGC
jgi:hypothetical protein